ncbi:MAG: LLM class flavin-dependent oxidoreductase, partial [Rhodospirillaceae bacterium]|nr:LLM class flavin-dependent oxidoreductase [Rhodospirillaceae bacterium]
KPVPLIVAAMGPRMLELAGRYTDGTALWMTGPRTIAQHVLPTMGNAASAAGRPSPRVIAGFPIVLTNQVDETRAKIGEMLQVYGQLPSYRAMLDREGMAGPAELALVGDEAALDRAISQIAEAGTTDLIAHTAETDPGAQARTLDYLQSRL